MFKFVVESVPKEGGVYVGTKIKKLFRQIEFHIFFPCIQVDEIKTCDIFISISRIFCYDKIRAY